MQFLGSYKVVLPIFCIFLTTILHIMYYFCQYHRLCTEWLLYHIWSIAVTVDFVFTWKARHTLNFDEKLRFALKFCICAIWTIILPAVYATSQKNYVCSTKLSQSNLYLFCLSPYMIVVAIYLTSNVVGMALFFFPAVSSYLETSNWQICKFISWWAQVSIVLMLLYA